MIELIVKMLDVDEFIGKSKNIDIAKGVNELTTNLSKARTQVKRQQAWQ